MTMGLDETSPDGRWSIEWVVKKDFSAYFESDTTYEVRVSNTATHEVVETFYRNVFENSEGEQRTGVSAVQFAEDGSAVIASYEDGRTERVELPPPDNGHQA